MSGAIRALYAEDNAADADLTKTHFDLHQPDFQLDVVGTAGAFLARLREHSYDVLLLDNHLPDADGVDLLKQVSDRDVLVPIVLVTASGDEELVVRALRLGAWDYVPKQGDYIQQLPAVMRRAVADYKRLNSLGIGRTRRRIVYAEHDAADIDLTVVHCAEAAPHLNFEIVPTVDAALARLERGDIDLLLTDLRMPDRSALDLLRDARQRDIRVPIVVITGQGDEAAAVAALKLGAFDYIVKRAEYLTRLPYALENAIHRAQLVEMNRRLHAELAERRRAEMENTRLLSQVDHERQRLAEIVATVPGIVWEAWGRPGRDDHRMDFVSDHVEVVLGYSRAQWLATPNFWLSIVHPEDRERAAREAVECFDSGRGGISQFRCVARDGRVVWLEVRFNVNRDAGGAPAGMRGVTMDITADKKAEAHRSHLEAQLRQAQRLESIGRLAGGVAHDFNNFVTAINGYADLMLQSVPPDHQWAADLAQIRSAGEHAATLTRQLLAFSRKQLLQPRVLALNALVEGTSRLLTRLLGDDIELVTRLDPALDNVFADAGQIEQVIMNLAVNGRDAMPRGGTLTIETRNVVLDDEVQASMPPGAYVRLAVSDTGSGIPPEALPHIFEPFFTTKALGKGTGLGLSTVYGIVKQTGGWVWVSSEPDRGTRFDIYLSPVDQPVTKMEEPRAASDSPRGSETVLLVEDDESVRRLVSQVLRKSGYEVIEAFDAAEAIRLASGHGGPIPLMVTDVVMPRLSGGELAARLHETRPEMRVLFMSGYTDDSVVRHGLIDSAMAFIQKPFTAHALASRVRDVLDRT